MIKIGEFVSNSGSLRITDPCYTKDTWCAGVVENCVKGKWEAFIEKQEIGGWGERVSKLIVRAVDSEYHDPIGELLDIDVGVDSGQAGIFDDGLFGTQMKQPHALAGNLEYEIARAEYQLNSIPGEDLETSFFKSTRDNLISIIEDLRNQEPQYTRDFYKICCDKTLGNMGAGTVEYGAVSSSGLGDGSYSAYAKRGDDDKVYEISIDFLGGLDEDEEE